MARVTLIATVRRVLRELSQEPERGDGALLARFAAHRDEGVFATLVHRHGPMVLGVCRRLVGDAHEAEDVFQATFLVLARQAGRLTARQSVAGLAAHRGQKPGARHPAHRRALAFPREAASDDGTDGFE